MAAVSVDGVVCRFGATEVLRGVDFSVRPGQIHAVLGPNGAGKTTLLRVISGLQEPDGGRVRVLGRQPDMTSRSTRQSVGVVPSGNRSFYLRLHGTDNLAFFARLAGLRRREAVEHSRAALHAVGLEEAARKRVGLYSQGMQKRLGLARGILTRPAVLIVDEATHDLDPEGAARIRELVAAEAERGAAVIWATQRLDEIRGFAHRVTVLHAGTVRFCGTVPELTATTTTQRFLVRLRNGSGPVTLGSLRSAIGARGTVDPTADADHWLLGLHDDVVLGDALDALRAVGVATLSCREEQSLVEAALLRLTHESASTATDEDPAAAVADGDPAAAVADEDPAPAWADEEPGPAVAGAEPTAGRGWDAVLSDTRKIAAFLRRDFAVMLSYRLAFLSDWGGLLLQVVLFGLLGRMIDPASLPSFGGTRPSYLGFVTIGLAVNALMQVGLTRVVGVIRNEQLMGTLESLLLTPTALATVQFGSAVYHLVYVSLRTVLFLVAVGLLFDARLELSNLAPAVAVLAVFLPFVWGVGVASAAAVLTFRHGSGAIGFGATILAAASGAYFPVDVLPAWAQVLMRYNPVTIALEGSREALLGGAGWSQVAPDVLVLAPMAVASVALGSLAFRMALRRELRRGTLNLY